MYSNIVAEILKVVPNSKTAKLLATMKMIATKESIKCFSSEFKYEDFLYPSLLANGMLSDWVVGCLFFEQLTDATLLHCNKLGEIWWL